MVSKRKRKENWESEPWLFLPRRPSRRQCRWSPCRSCRGRRRWSSKRRRGRGRGPGRGGSCRSYRKCGTGRVRRVRCEKKWGGWSQRRAFWWRFRNGGGCCSLPLDWMFLRAIGSDHQWRACKKDCEAVSLFYTYIHSLTFKRGRKCHGGWG